MKRTSLAALAVAAISPLSVGVTVAPRITADAPAAAPAPPAPAAPAAPAALTIAAAPNAVAGITLVGHGNGHGVGLSQWGAYGYAVDHGWDAWAIVDHYYGGTVHGTAPLGAIVTVRLQGLDGVQTAVVAHAADVTATAPVVGVVPALPATRAMVARFVPGTGYSLWSNTVEACPSSSDPLAGWSLSATGLASVTFSTAPTNPDDVDQLVSTCRPDGTVRTYRGTIQAVTGTAAEIRTVNAVPVEQYLRAVVAKEMSPSWANAGGGRGIAALRAQVIAGRSYALSEKLYSYAMTCDSVCQTYQGAATRTALGATYAAVENRLSDPAVASTAAMVLRNGDGTVVHAMYAASSGGYTADNPVLRFPAVPDDGDTPAHDPDYTWTTTLSAAAVQAAYPAVGTLTGITVLQRNGLGDLGGRVTRMTVDGSAGSVAISGDQFRSAMGLKSNWFALTGAPPAGANTITSGATALAPAKRLPNAQA